MLYLLLLANEHKFNLIYLSWDLNQVLLATTWQSLSCWTISKESIHQIQRLVRNYIWSGKEDHVTRAKVAWPILTTPKSRGGLGLIDPLTQSKAVLAKFLVRGLC